MPGLCDLAARANQSALDAITIVILIFGGRIVPLFTKGATAAELRSADQRDSLGLWLMVFYALLHTAFPEQPATSVCAMAVGALTIARLYGWGTLRTLGKPIVWGLHA